MNRKLILPRWAWLRADDTVEVCEAGVTRAFMRAQQFWLRRKDWIVRVTVRVQR